MNKNKIYKYIDSILLTRFKNDLVKQNIIEKPDSLRFSCPYCGDSKKTSHLKRGNFYFSTGFYHCFNCGIHLSGISLLNYFNKEFNDYKIIDDIKKLNVKSNLTNLSVDLSVDDVENVAIDLRAFIQKNKLYTLPYDHPFLKKRLMTHKNKHFAIKGKYLYIFNLYKDKIIGYQLRHLERKYYEKFPLTRIYEENDWLDMPEKLVDSSFNKVSLIYDIFNVDTTSKFTIFEGPIDSWSYMKNCMGTSSVVVNTDFLDVTNNSRYFYDNGKDGRLKMIDKLNKGNYVFLWKKFLKENNITDKLNDMNDILRYFYLKKQLHKIHDLDKYFSKNKFNLLYV